MVWQSPWINANIMLSSRYQEGPFPSVKRVPRTQCATHSHAWSRGEDRRRLIFTGTLGTVPLSIGKCLVWNNRTFRKILPITNMTITVTTRRDNCTVAHFLPDFYVIRSSSKLTTLRVGATCQQNAFGEKGSGGGTVLDLIYSYLPDFSDRIFSERAVHASII